MTFNDINSLTYSDLLYVQFCTTCAIYQEHPIKGDLYTTANGLTLNVYKRKINAPIIKTKKISASPSDMKDILKHFENDFPHFAINRLDDIDTISIPSAKRRCTKGSS